jgi:hypothetical protein
MFATFTHFVFLFFYRLVLVITFGVSLPSPMSARLRACVRGTMAHAISRPLRVIVRACATVRSA